MFDEKIDIYFVLKKTKQTKRFQVTKGHLVAVILLILLFIGGTILGLEFYFEKKEYEARLKQVEEVFLECRNAHKEYVDSTRKELGETRSFLKQIKELLGLSDDYEEEEENDDGIGGGKGGPVNSFKFLGREIKEISDGATYSIKTDSLIKDIKLVRRTRKSCMEIIEFIENKKVLLDHTPCLLPIDGQFRFTSFYGYRIHPIFKRFEFHKGVDIGAKFATRVLAAASGIVDRVSRDYGMGNYIEIYHGAGYYFNRYGDSDETAIVTRYGHLSTIIVREGQEVGRGEVIGYVGSTGVSTGPHLHYEVLVNYENVNPEKYILYIKSHKKELQDDFIDMS